MEIVAAVLILVLVSLIFLNSATINRAVTIGGKAFSATQAVTANLALAVEATVAAATAGTMTATAQASKTVTGATWAANVATFTTSAAHGYLVGQVIVVAGMTPSGYNGTFVVASTPLTTTFTVALGANPGAFSAGGTITSYDTFTCTTSNPFAVSDRIDLYSGTTTITCRRGYTAQAIVGLAVGVSGGAGTVPTVTAAVQACKPTELPLVFTGNNVVTFAVYSDGVSVFTFVQSDGTTETLAKLFQTSPYQYSWDNKSPDTNPFAGASNGYVWVSHKDITKSHTMRAGVMAN